MPEGEVVTTTTVGGKKAATSTVTRPVMSAPATAPTTAAGSDDRAGFCAWETRITVGCIASLIHRTRSFRGISAAESQSRLHRITGRHRARARVRAREAGPRAASVGSGEAVRSRVVAARFAELRDAPRRSTRFRRLKDGGPLISDSPSSSVEAGAC